MDESTERGANAGIQSHVLFGHNEPDHPVPSDAEIAHAQVDAVFRLLDGADLDADRCRTPATWRSPALRKRGPKGTCYSARNELALRHYHNAHRPGLGRPLLEAR